MNQHHTPSVFVNRQLGLRRRVFKASRSFVGIEKVKNQLMPPLLRTTIGLLAISLVGLTDLAFAQNAPVRPAGQKPNAPALPPGYAPPSAAPPVFTFQKALLDEDTQKSLKRSAIGITTTLRGQGNGLSPQDKKKIQDWAKLRVYEMTMPEHFTPPVVKYTTDRPKPGEMNAGGAEGFLPDGGGFPGPGTQPRPEPEKKKIPRFDSVADVREKLERELRSTGSLASRTDQVKMIRTVVCKEVAARAEEVLDNNYWVRLNAVILLGNLNVLEDDGRRGTTRQAYAPAYKPLVKVLLTPTGGQLDQQHESVKIRAALGLKNIALTASLADLGVLDKDEIARALISELKQPNNHWWYKQSLIQALSAVDLVQDAKNAKPIILEALGDVLTDQNQELIVRAYAAKALGRIPLPGTVEWPTLAHRIVQLAKEVAETYQKSPGRADLREALWCIYLAFKPETHLEIQRYSGRKQKAGFLSNTVPAVINEAYQQVVPLASHAINQPVQGQAAQIPAEQIATLTQWLQNKTPANNKLAPNISDLNPIGPLKTAAEPGSSGGE
ncbi:HEAT repeat domain-containing protein [Thalassoroseus pseudoceratinae]|uniref:HEAT repeat domain-containing protein n=1 Tax=Thalassoroseus pseudoceratinae TaxID=2713176 RepID=UPI0014246FE3|nr:hypothetical protein [Thalassoroseus pseudoceratinae]